MVVLHIYDTLYLFSHYNTIYILFVKIFLVCPAVTNEKAILIKILQKIKKILKNILLII